MKAIPKRYVRELGRVAKETGTAIEINSKANLQNPTYSARYVEEYYEFLCILADQGPQFSCASDAHDIGDLASVQASWKMVERLGLGEDQIWSPRCRPIKAG